MNERDFVEQFRYDPEKDLLGSGGFGTVYRAYDRFKNRYVAIKISQVKDIFGKFTLLNEVKLSQEIDDHANVARYEFGLRVRLPFPVDYAVMAFYEEGNLDMVLQKKHNVLSAKELYEIVEGLLEGINHLHNENVIHRDLKLANILMMRTKQGQWRPKIADFGLSRQMETYEASIANSAIGITVAYAAPEQIENRPIRKNVDLWAIGVIIYRILTGEMPFAPIDGTEPTSATIEMSRKITQVQLPKKLDNLPLPYRNIILRCWVKDVKERAQSATELLQILRNNKPIVEEIDENPPLSSIEEGSIQTLLLTDALPMETSIELPIVPLPISDPILLEKSMAVMDEVTSLDFIQPFDDTDKTVIAEIPTTVATRTTNDTPSISLSNTLLANKRKILLIVAALCLLLGILFFKQKTPSMKIESVTPTHTDTSGFSVSLANKDTNRIQQQLPNNIKTVIPAPTKEKVAEVKTDAPQPKTESTSKPIEQVSDITIKVSCCCAELNTGTMTVHNFIIEANGHVSTSNNTTVTIVNNGKTITVTNECQEKVLSVFKRYSRWPTHSKGYEIRSRYDVDF